MEIPRYFKEKGIEIVSNQPGEYALDCPVCKGIKTLQSWPAKERFLCRCCDISGNITDLERILNKYLTTPSALEVAIEEFVSERNLELLKNDEKLEQLKKQAGLKVETVSKFKVGWNDQPRTFNDKIIPAGWVIPCRDFDRKLINAKMFSSIRDENPLLIAPSGTLNCVTSFFSTLLGENQKKFILVESEIVAMLLAQEAKAGIVAVALGNLNNIPSGEELEILKNAKHVLVSFEIGKITGKVQQQFWQENFKDAQIWLLNFLPAKYSNDFINAFMAGFPLGGFVQAGFHGHTDKTAYIVPESFGLN